MNFFKISVSFFAFLATSLALSAQPVDVVATQFMEMMGKGKAGEAYYMLDSNVQGKITPVQLGLVWQQLEKKYGDWKGVKSGKSEELQGMTALYTENDFTRAMITMKVVVNANKKIAGFTIGKIDEKKEFTTPIPAGLTEQNITVAANGGHLQGTVTLPAGDKKFPVVLIIAGSGPTDRDGNNMLGVSAQSYRLLAYELAQNGIASLRYDKRYLGGSNDFKGDVKDLVLEDFIDDAVQCMKLLKADSRFNEVYVIGHSEGSLIGMLAVQKTPVNGYISLCGAGDPLDKVLDGQIKVTMPDQYAAGAKIIKALKADAKLPEVPTELKSIFNEQTAQFIHSLFQYDPCEVFKKVKMPSFIIAGGHDLQIGVHDANLLSKCNSAARLLIIDSMNHVLKDAPAEANGNLKVYTDAKLPINAQLVKGLTAFILEEKKMVSNVQVKLPPVRGLFS